MIIRELLIDDPYKLRAKGINYYDCIIDVGGHHGHFTIMARTLNPKATIMSVEPCPKNFKKLNNATHGLKIQKYNFALGDGKSVYVHQHHKPECTHTSNSPRDPRNPKYRPSKVNTRTIAHIVKQAQVHHKIPFKTQKVLLKIDVEGAERHLLKDTPADIIKNISNIAIETHHHAGNASKMAWTKWLDTIKKIRNLKCSYRCWGKLGNILIEHKD